MMGLIKNKKNGDDKVKDLMIRSSAEEFLTFKVDEKELEKDSTYSKMELVQKEGNRNVKRNVEFYNLDAIISVGYRVNSVRATQFRRWATGVLRTFTIQGYVLDKERMKNGSFINQDYFDKLLAEIRENYGYLCN